MFNKNTNEKKKAFDFYYTELSAMAEYLEQQESKGYRLKRFENNRLIFEKCEPRNIRYSVEIFKGSSYREFIESCTLEGWEHVTTYNGELYIFRTQKSDAIDIMTDEKEKFKTTAKRMVFQPGLWSFIFSAFYPLYHLIFRLNRGITINVFETDVFNYIALMLIVIYVFITLLRLFDCFFWQYTVRKKGSDSPFFNLKNTIKKRRTYAIINVIFFMILQFILWWIAPQFYSSIFVILFSLALLFCRYYGANLTKLSFDKNGKTKKTILICVVIALCIGGAFLLKNCNEKYVIENSKTTLSLDEAPISVEDLNGKVKSCEDTCSVEGTRFGHLFSFKSSVKSGYFENFKKRKKGKKLLTRCMLLFSAIIVLMTAIFGTAIGELIEIENAFNPNTFYVFASDAQTTHKLNAAVGDGQSGIDYFYLSNSIPDREMRFSFSPGNFESVTYNYYRYALESEAIMLPIGMDKELKLVCGNRDGLEKHDVLITTETADKLLESSGFEHITDYNDLIGMVSDSVIIEGKGIRIAGILKSKERVIYIDEYLIAQKTFADVFYNDLSLGVASDYGKELANGEAAVIVNFDDFKNNRKLPKVGESISVHGKSFKISDVDIVFGSYGKWLDYNGLTPVSMNQFLKELIKEKYPDYTPIQCDQAVEKAMSDPYYHYYFCSYYIEYYDEFIRANCKYGSLEPLPVWLYTEKGIEDMKYYFSGYYDLYRAEKFKELYGDYPTSDQHYSEEYQNIPEFEFVLESYVKEYIDEYNQSYTPYPVVDTYALLVSKDDYIELSKIQGETYDFYGAFSSDDVYNIDYYEIVYAVIHSSDPELTDRYLNSEFSDVESPSYYYPAIATPESLHSDQLSLGIGKIVSRLIAMVTLLVLMSICMYFIMRSSLMNRIKETGIYRAIGVSKKNLVFKFFIEAMVLTTVTVFIGYILTSSFIFVCLGWSPFVKEIFFYPVWLAALVLIILYALSLFCGTLPILMLLRKTPSEILAKYDI